MTSRMQEHDRRTSTSSDDLRHSTNRVKYRSFTTCAMSIQPMYLEEKGASPREQEHSVTRKIKTNGYTYVREQVNYDERDNARVTEKE